MNGLEKSSQARRKPFDSTQDLSSCLSVSPALIHRDTPRALTLHNQRTNNYRSVKELHEKAKLLRLSELYGSPFDSEAVKKFRRFYKQKFIDSKINDCNFIRL